MTPPIDIPKTNMYSPRVFDYPRLSHSLVNQKKSCELEWTGNGNPPERKAKEFPVVLCYNVHDDEYQVCYWDGKHYLQMADDMPFECHKWTYLPDTKDSD